MWSGRSKRPPCSRCARDVFASRTGSLSSNNRRERFKTAHRSIKVSRRRAGLQQLWRMHETSEAITHMRWCEAKARVELPRASQRKNLNADFFRAGVSPQMNHAEALPVRAHFQENRAARPVYAFARNEAASKQESRCVIKLPCKDAIAHVGAIRARLFFLVQKNFFVGNS